MRSWELEGLKDLFQKANLVLNQQKVRSYDDVAVNSSFHIMAVLCKIYSIKIHFGWEGIYNKYTFDYILCNLYLFFNFTEHCLNG